MLAEERRIRIREMLATHKTVAASELAASFSVAMATVRRDLVVLEREGVLLRSHGGAVSRSSSADFQLSFEVLQKTSRAEKFSRLSLMARSFSSRGARRCWRWPRCCGVTRG